MVVNLRHLEAHNVSLEGDLAAAELDIDTRDEVIHVAQPLHYRAEVQKVENGLLVQGRLRLTLDCQCVRCLKPCQHEVNLPNWTCHVPLQGEDRAPVVSDCVDLTPYAREDILLEFPRHPLCDAECRGLPGTSSGRTKRTSGANKNQAGSSAWAELNKLKL